ncbi:beta-1,2-xylosyltransferase XYXT1-like [Senna tora]|uniref:Beta-1,2-xylosyltransferase XYXT1-like n=1 Tax=Senna tora TaxID=362788 RepID=A0A834TDB1_9FABA|nr:beta-1,2-xylosyltransferase XYXT1-like [Senna tora]
MVQFHRNHIPRKGGENAKNDMTHHDLDFAIFSYCKRTKPKLLSFVFLTILCSFFVLAPLFLGSFSFCLFYSIETEHHRPMNDGVDVNASFLSSSISSSDSNETELHRPMDEGVHANASFLSSSVSSTGDIRTHSASSSVFLYLPSTTTHQEEERHEKIKPYTRKWETGVMNKIQELNLISKTTNLGTDTQKHNCDVHHHDVPAVFFSNGGYTGNVYHEFNDGIIPLYITSQHFNKRVIFVILEYHNWWMMKYRDVLSQLTDFPLIDFNTDNRTHCFSQATIGLTIHDELTVNPTLMTNKGHQNKTIQDFRSLLNSAYSPRIKNLMTKETKRVINKRKKPKMVVISRTGSRSVRNENAMVKKAEEMGFEVEVMRPNRRTEMSKIYRTLNESDVMVGVHGAAMTHFLFMRPGRVFLQVVPLGTTWAAETYYGEPARKMGLKYIGYEIGARESSLWEKYDREDPVLRDPNSINKKGWEYTKRIYLENQNVTLDLRRFQRSLRQAYQYCLLDR